MSVAPEPGSSACIVKAWKCRAFHRRKQHWRSLHEHCFSSLMSSVDHQDFGGVPSPPRQGKKWTTVYLYYLITLCSICTKASLQRKHAFPICSRPVQSRRVLLAVHIILLYMAVFSLRGYSPHPGLRASALLFFSFLFGEIRSTLMAGVQTSLRMRKDELIFILFLTVVHPLTRSMSAVVS